MATYRDIRTGAFISQATYNRSMSHGGNPKNFEQVSEENISTQPERIFNSVDDFYYNEDDFTDYDELIFEGGADYGE